MSNTPDSFKNTHMLELKDGSYNKPPDWNPIWLQFLSGIDTTRIGPLWGTSTACFWAGLNSNHSHIILGHGIQHMISIDRHQWITQNKLEFTILDSNPKDNPDLPNSTCLNLLAAITSYSPRPSGQLTSYSHRSHKYFEPKPYQTWIYLPTPPELGHWNTLHWWPTEDLWSTKKIEDKCEKSEDGHNYIRWFYDQTDGEQITTCSHCQCTWHKSTATSLPHRENRQLWRIIKEIKNPRNKYALLLPNAELYVAGCISSWSWRRYESHVSKWKNNQLTNPNAKLSLSINWDDIELVIPIPSQWNSPLTTGKRYIPTFDNRFEYDYDPHTDGPIDENNQSPDFAEWFVKLSEDFLTD